jgi:maltose/moltooligosaccharide transporter
MEQFKLENEKSKGFFKGVAEITTTIFSMPKTMLKLGLVQFFSWFAFFAMWSLATPALTSHVFNASFPDVNLFDLTDAVQKANYEAGMQLYNDAADLVGSYMGMYGLSSMAFALLLTMYTSKFRINRKFIHMASLLAGGIGFIMMYYITDHHYLMYSFILIGISWGSILSMPYAMLSSSIDPNKMGVYMGIFNMFIVIPQIIAATGGLNFLYQAIYGEASINAMLLAGTSLVLAALSNLLITNKKAITYTE